MKKKKTMTNRLMSVPGGWVQIVPQKVNLKVDEGRVYGARYYTVAPEFPHTLTWFNPNWEAMLSWCVTTFGPTPEDGVWTPEARWYVNHSKFWFRTEADRDWFLLKWQ